MLRVTCEDLGVEGCDFEAEGDKARRVEDEMYEHIRAEHPELLSGLDWKQHTAFEHRVRDAIQSH